MNRGRLLQEALALLDSEGAERFSMRRLAEHLSVTPMALYNHVRSKRELLQGIAEALVDQVSYPSSQGEWRKVVRECFRALRRACLAHPGAVSLVESAKTLPAAVFRPMEITLNALQRAGFSPDDGLRAYSLLMTFTLGQVSYQIKGWARGVDATAAVSDGRIDRATHPAVVRSITREGWDFDKSFEFGLSIIVAGLAARARRM